MNEKVQHTKARVLRVSSPEFLFNYKHNLFLKSDHFGRCPLLIFLYIIGYNNILWRPHDPHDATALTFLQWHISDFSFSLSCWCHPPFLRVSPGAIRNPHKHPLSRFGLALPSASSDGVKKRQLIGWFRL